MALKISKYVRKAFYVDAVTVTEDNMEEAAKWCRGKVKTVEDSDQKYILVKVHRPVNDRQTKAFVGDRVLKAGTGYKVYRPTAFDKSFEPVRTLTKKQADEANVRPPIEQPPRKPVNAVPGPPKKKAVDATITENGNLQMQYSNTHEEKATPESADAELQRILDEAEEKHDE